MCIHQRKSKYPFRLLLFMSLTTGTAVPFDAELPEAGRERNMARSAGWTAMNHIAYQKGYCSANNIHDIMSASESSCSHD